MPVLNTPFDRACAMLEERTGCEMPEPIAAKLVTLLEALTRKPETVTDREQALALVGTLGSDVGGDRDQVAALIRDLACLDPAYRQERAAILTEAWGFRLVPDKPAMPEASTIETAADALLQIIVRGARERDRTQPNAPLRATPFVWRDPTTIPTRDALDLHGLTSDPIGTACRAELRRIGHALHAADPGRDLDGLAVDLAEMDPTHADWRAIVLETAWAGIGGAA